MQHHTYLRNKNNVITGTDFNILNNNKKLYIKTDLDAGTYTSDSFGVINPRFLRFNGFHFNNDIISTSKNQGNYVREVDVPNDALVYIVDTSENAPYEYPNDYNLNWLFYVSNKIIIK